MPDLLNRREFLRAAMSAAGVAAVGGAAGLLSGCRESASTLSEGRSGGAGADRKLIIVLFGGGTRSSEAIDDPQHRWIPNLWNEMVPRGTLLTNMRVEGKVVHPNSAGSIMTGHWEWDDIDWSHPVDHPTVFEVCRKSRQRPDTSAWAFVYASILANIGVSRAKGFGARYAANVVEPPTIPRATAEEMDRLMRHAAEVGSPQAELRAAGQSAQLVRRNSRIFAGGIRSPQARRFLDDRFGVWKAASETTSHDRFLADSAVAAMERFAPDILAVCFGEIDCAHYGSWSRYVDAIARTDELTAKLWKAVQASPEYRDRTLMMILPDHGRELERAGGSGFLHHSDFYTNQGADEGCRRVWMLALGPGVAAGRKIERPLPITAAAATGLDFLRISRGKDAEKSILSMLL